MASDDGFVAATHAELFRLVAEADTARRRAPAHPGCADGPGMCRHCAKVRSVHALIDDHLDQLEGREPTDADLSAWLAEDAAS